MSHKPFSPGPQGLARSTHRPARFAQRVREELVELVPGGLKDPRLEGLRFLTITGVEITPDLKYAQVTFALMDESARSKDVEEALNQAAGFLRRELMRRLNTKITPHLTFRYDRGFSSTERIDELLKSIK